MVDIREIWRVCVETYPAVPRPSTVEVSCVVLTYPRDARPVTEDTRVGAIELR